MSVVLAGPCQSLIASSIPSTVNGAERRFESTVDSCVMELCHGGALFSPFRSVAARVDPVLRLQLLAGPHPHVSSHGFGRSGFCVELPLVSEAALARLAIAMARPRATVGIY